MRKRVVEILLSAALVIGILSSCGSTDTNSAANTENAADAESTEDADMAAGTENAEDAEAAEAESTEDADMAAGTENAENTADAENTTDQENTALAFVHDMKIGWNLGNTMDATISGTAADDLAVETAWQSTVTTQDMIDDLKEAGFNTLRLPVSWHNHVSGDDYTISEVWLDRVQEIVDYA